MFEVHEVDDGQVAFTTVSDDLRTFMKYLENSNYSTIIYALNNRSKLINNDNEIKKSSSLNHLHDISGYCDVISTELSNFYNKNIIFWPCPKMKFYCFKFIRICLLNMNSIVISKYLRSLSKRKRQMPKMSQTMSWAKEQMRCIFVIVKKSQEDEKKLYLTQAKSIQNKYSLNFDSGKSSQTKFN
ncbi:hypothetical protein PVAND_010389 [Polypedilum vanderplanki]|uniref:Uncharacterized protein n=1 Tax=Polypedilum vanderplanki TaxID=319348 RepID=A0A9J6CG92_POLVA|nr:hypothetical protein PVAND_010389 [Polypedilum vanderplanki]